MKNFTLHMPATVLAEDGGFSEERRWAHFRRSLSATLASAGVVAVLFMAVLVAILLFWSTDR